MPGHFYYDMSEFDYDFDYMNFTNATDLYSLGDVAFTSVDFIVHVLVYIFLLMYAAGLFVITLVVVFAPFWVSLLMVLAVFCKWNDSKPSRHHSDSAEID